MSLIIEPTELMGPAIQELGLMSASTTRTDRVNVFGYGPPGSGKSYFALTFPKPFVIDTDFNTLTHKGRVARGEIADFPIFQSTSWKTVLEVLVDPKARLANMFRGTEWEGYEPETIILDTFSTLEGYTFDAILDQAKKDKKVSQNTWNELKRRMLAIARAAWNLPLNTVLLAHDQSGRKETEDMSKKDPGPLLTGTLLKQVPAQCDVYLYFQRRPTGFGTDEFLAHSVPTMDGMPARANGIELEREIVNPSYVHIRAALDKLERQNQERKAQA